MGIMPRRLKIFKCDVCGGIFGYIKYTILTKKYLCAKCLLTMENIDRIIQELEIMKELEE